MKRILFTTMALASLLAGCGTSTDGNPLLTEYNTPFNTPPFDRIRPEHYLPAFETALAEARAEVDSIRNNPAPATFENTIEALEYKGERLGNISSIFFNLLEAETSEQMQQIAQQVKPMLTEFSNDLSLDPVLFDRVRTVWEQRDSLSLDPDQQVLLEDTYKSFTRRGAGLGEADKARFREITTELSGLSLRFGQNVLNATNDFVMHLTDPEAVAPMPDFVREGMAQEARDRGMEGWCVTLQAPSIFPFLTYSPFRELKERVWMKYNTRGLAADSTDNRDIVRRITALRLEMANLLGYPTYADYVLEEKMAGNRATVDAFLHDLLDKSLPYARKDYETIRDYANASGMYSDFKMMPWDWAYFDEKYKNEHYALSDEQIKPYLQLENVRKGIFLLANKLYGLTFKENREIPVFHPDVTAYEVYDEQGKFMAVLYLDFFPRASKRGGAWMTSFREMYLDREGHEVRPLVSVTCNFTKPTDSIPSLLTFDEFTTFLHEFGHALHGMLAEGRYASLTGTNVRHDFVELPSQIMENWATEKEFLDLWAVHYQTGEKIPAELIDKIVAARTYNAAYANVRQVAYGLNDMAWHSITAPVTEDVVDFEKRAMAPAQLLPVVPGTGMSTSFTHIFSGGYAAGYYGYKWAEVLEADAFSLFKEKGIFNREVADSFRRNILAKGGSEHPMVLFERFRGHKPDNRAMLERMGIRE